MELDKSVVLAQTMEYFVERQEELKAKMRSACDELKATRSAIEGYESQITYYSGEISIITKALEVLRDMRRKIEYDAHPKQ